MKIDVDAELGNPARLVTYNMGNSDEEEKPNTSSATMFKKPSGFALSKKNLKDAPIREFLRCRCASGTSTNEDDVYDRFPSRYRRSDCLRVLRIFHQNHSRFTRLEVVNGLWTLTPLPFSDGEQE